MPRKQNKRRANLPTMINHSGFLTRSSSFWGSRRDSTFTFSASLISSAVLWRMNTGLPRHLTMTCSHQYLSMVMWRVVRTFLPSGIVDKSTSTFAMAKTSADADMFTKKSVCCQISALCPQLIPPSHSVVCRPLSRLQAPRPVDLFIHSLLYRSTVSKAPFPFHIICQRTLNSSLSSCSSQSTHRSNHNYAIKDQYPSALRI
jgi:hypothetical protein